MSDPMEPPPWAFEDCADCSRRLEARSNRSQAGGSMTAMRRAVRISAGSISSMRKPSCGCSP